MSKKTILSSRQSSTISHEKSDRHIVAMSGGIASAWVAHWARLNCPKDKTIYYFNDTLWEHPDLYRFLRNIEGCFDIDIMRDTDGRTPEQVFYDVKMLGNNRAPICSRALKAERLQSFIHQGDTIYFGIDPGEIHRAARITPIYERFGCSCRFPLIEEMVTRDQMFETIKDYGIEIPQMYKDGFTHNNCSGGCVRAGMKQWVSLFYTYPEVFAERERVEIEFTKWNNERTGKSGDYHFMKEMSLSELRRILESQQEFDFEDNTEWEGECIGICGDMA